MHDTVCIIDDDEIYAFGIKRIIELRKLGSNVLIFSSGEEALAYLQSNIKNRALWPKVILLDVGMPVMSGWQFLDYFIEQMGNEIIAQGTRLYIVSSSIDPKDMMRAKYNGFVADYILKPVTANMLSAMLSQRFED